MDYTELNFAIRRISEMELRFDTLENAFKINPDAMAEGWFKNQLQILLQYYEGGQWLRDFKLDEQGLLPADLKRGVLSEDAVYNFLTDLNEI